MLIINPKRDIPLMIFIWKWKMATTSCLHQKFFSKTKLPAAYKRLWELRTAGFLATRSIDLGNTGHVWVLDKKGFALIQAQLPSLKEIGYKSEFIWHDLLSMSLNLGDFLCDLPQGSMLISEQQIRRMHTDELPKWMPAPERHRPDGYIQWIQNNRKITLALEVELQRKTNLIYNDIAQFYQESPVIDLVLWMVSSMAIANNILKCAFLLDPNRVSIHNFFLASDYLNSYWNSEIKVGSHAGKRVCDIYQTAHVTSSVQRRARGYAQVILDTRLKYQND